MPLALVSVHDKTGLAGLARRLAARGFRFLASGGTGAFLRGEGLEVLDIASYTNSDEMLGGRVKTLHPAVHAGILARGTPADLAELAARGYSPIDLVVVNLYPFEWSAATPGATEEEVVEDIDIGGVALMRAAAKNRGRVCLLSDPADYEEVAAAYESGGPPAALVLRLAAKGFARTAAYDAAISSWLSGPTAEDLRGGEGHPEEMAGDLRLRYGENPHQAALFRPASPGGAPLGGRLLAGKELSYNNVLDLDAAWRAVHAQEGCAAVIVKHLSPCGAALGASPGAAFQAALATDPLSAYGGVVAFNRPVDRDCALRLAAVFLECVAAPGFGEGAREVLSSRRGLRLLEADPRSSRLPSWEARGVSGGLLLQERDQGDPEGSEWRVVSARSPSPAELEDLRFAWRAVREVRSNAIVLASGGATVGIGGGQTSRVDAVRQALARAGERARGAVMASDAFFPFPDGIEEAARAGVRAVVHPGGSIRDAEVIAAADRAGLVLVATGTRHFRH